MGLSSWVAGSGVVQGLIIGATLAFLTTVGILDVVARAETRTVHGWSAIRRVGRPGNGLLVRAALQKALPVANVFEEAAYWTAIRDGTGKRLSGERSYRLHFPAGQLPPGGAFWSLTATDAVGYMVGNPAGPASVDDHSGLVRNADDSVDILVQSHEPPGAARNWLAAPPGRFKLMLRVYLPAAAVLRGDYEVPPLVEVGS